MTVSILPPASQARLESLLRGLRERGCRVTPQRLAVLRILLGSEEHLSVEEVFERVRGDYPTTSLGTIYKTVHLLKEMGEVLEIGTGRGSNRYDGFRPRPHPHLICVRCNAVQDADLPGLAALSEDILQASGFRVLHHRFDLFGICPQCQSNAKS